MRSGGTWGGAVRLSGCKSLHLSESCQAEHESRGYVDRHFYSTGSESPTVIIASGKWMRSRTTSRSPSEMLKAN
jgi:hypothetical protein